MLQSKDISRKLYGYDRTLPLERYRMLYTTWTRGNVELVTAKNLMELAKAITNQDVGYKCSTNNLFRRLQFKRILFFLKRKPKIKILRSKLSTFSSKQIMSNAEVMKFLTTIIPTYISNRVFGKPKLFMKFLRNLKKLLFADFLHTVTIGDLMKGLNKGISRKTRHFRAKLALWITNTFVIKLLGRLFHITRTTKGNSVLFYKIRYWQRLETNKIKELINCGHLSESVTNRIVPILRLLPKPSGGLRPVIIERIQRIKYWNNLSKTLLHQLLKTKTGKVGSPLSDLHLSWTNFIDNKLFCKQLYFVKTDIKDAFGSIKHDVLINILKKLFETIPSQNLTMLECYQKGPLGKTFKKIQFKELEISISQKILNIVPKNKCVRKSFLENHILNYIRNTKVRLKAGNQIFKFLKGVPQGGSLSSVLSEIYYHNMDSIHLQIKEEGDLFLRSVDDYLFITKNKQRALRFLNKMQNGIESFGMKINSEKTISNIFNGKITSIEHFGLQMFPSNNQICYNLSKYEGITVLSTTRMTGKLSLRQLKEKMTRLQSLNMHAIAFDSSFQTKRTILQNIHTIATVLAFKFDGFLYVCLINKLKDIKRIIKIILSSSTILARKCCTLIRISCGPLLVDVDCAKIMIIKTFIHVLTKKKMSLLKRNIVIKLNTIFCHLLKKLKTREKKLIKQVAKEKITVN